MSTAPDLQTAIDRYATALAIPTMLERLHPRKQGNPGNAGALAPAIVLTSISAFEGFVEEFLALAAARLGQSYAQISKFVTMNNPTVETFETKLTQLTQWPRAMGWQSGFAVSVWDPPAVNGSTWITKKSLSWGDNKRESEGWMQVRHCLTHGLARGYRPEHWPGPLKGTVHAASVLRPQSGGKHSLSLHGAESCAHIYRVSAQTLAEEAVRFLGWPPLDWARVPDFAL